MSGHFEFKWWQVGIIAYAAICYLFEAIDACRIDKRKVYDEGEFQELDREQWEKEVEKFNKKLEERKSHE